MERTVWTDERLNGRFDRLDSDIRDLRTDVRDLRTLMFQLWGTNMLAILVTLVAVIVTNA